MDIKIVDTRKLRVQFQKSGSGSQNTRLNLPITWIRDNLKIEETTKGVPNIKVSLTEDNKIILEPIEES